MDKTGLFADLFKLALSVGDKIVQARTKDSPGGRRIEAEERREIIATLLNEAREVISKHI